MAAIAANVGSMPLDLARVSACRRLTLAAFVAAGVQCYWTRSAGPAVGVQGKVSKLHPIARQQLAFVRWVPDLVPSDTINSAAMEENCCQHGRHSGANTWNQPDTCAMLPAHGQQATQRPQQTRVSCRVPAAAAAAAYQSLSLRPAVGRVSVRTARPLAHLLKI